MLDSVRTLAVEIGPRVAGTPGEIAAREYIRDELVRDGYDVTVQDFPFDASEFLPARVDVAGMAVPAFILRGSGVGTVRGPLVSAGSGNPEDIPSSGLVGSIALIRRGGIPFSEKVKNAMAAGTIGVVIYNNGAGSLIGELSDNVEIPVIGIKQTAGEDLAIKLQAGPLDATITVTPPMGTAYNVVAKPRGTATCNTITGGHYDSVAVTGGADDNASGAAAVLEVARVIAARQHEAANCFVLFSAEELGLFGSRAFVEKLTPDELAALRAMVNLDVVGVETQLDLIGNDDLIETGRITAGKFGIDAVSGTLPAGASSDHVSFQKAGVPVLMLSREDNLIHTPDDAIDRIAAKSLADTVTVAVASLEALNAR